MNNSKNLRLLIKISVFCLISSVIFALDWDKEKYDFPEKDPVFMSKVQPYTEEYDWICQAAKTEVFERIYKEKQQEFLGLVELVSKGILETKNNVIGAPDPKKWEQVFRRAQSRWFEQLELDREEYFYSEAGQGGNCNYRYSLDFAVSKLEERIKDIKSRWWFKGVSGS